MFDRSSDDLSSLSLSRLRSAPPTLFKHHNLLDTDNLFGAATPSLRLKDIASFFVYAEIQRSAVGRGVL